VRLSAAERLGRWTTLIVLALVVLGPVYWIVASSLKDPREIISTTPSLWPASLYLGHYERLFASTPYVAYLTNSTVVAAATMLTTVIVSVAASYAMYRLRVRGSTLIGTAVLLSYLIPGTLLLVPVYTIFAAAGLVDSQLALVIVNVAFASPFCVWLMRGFFDAIPRELDDAAAVDGAGPLTTLVRVNLPLLAPGIGTIGLYAFVYSWTEVVFASQLILSDGLKTLPIGLAAIMGQYNIDWGLLMAGASLTMVPGALLFAAVGRYFVRGLTAGAVQ
jgi:ABC-type glycerol-3-phosphate transport system permease component